MSHHLAPSLVRLRSDVNAAWPGRSKVSDGWIGDTAHGARKSDHNPAPPTGIVRALDLTNEGIDVDRLVDVACADPRTAYVISRGLIYTRDNGFRPVRYTGSNSHSHHVHISIRHGATYEQSTASWNLTRQPTAAAGGGASAPIAKPLVPPTNLDFLEALMASIPVRFFAWRSGATTHIFEASLLAGTYRRIPDMTTLRDRKAILTGAGVPWENHPGGSGEVPGLVVNGSAYGVQVGS